VQLAEIAPFSIHVRCRSHGVNLVGKTAAEQPALKSAVTFAVAPATYYARSTARMNELNAVQRRLAPVKPKTVKCNIETRFVSIWSPMQRTWNIYPALVLHAQEALAADPHCDAALAFNRQMTDLQSLLYTAGSLPLMLELDSVCKLLQSRNIYMPDVLRRIEVCEQRVTRYYSGKAAFTTQVFGAFHNMIGSAAKERTKRTASPISFRDVDGQSVAHYIVGEGDAKQYIPLVAKPLPTGRAGRPSSLPQLIRWAGFRDHITHIKVRL
jgi:hypothetical protein